MILPESGDEDTQAAAWHHTQHHVDPRGNTQCDDVKRCTPHSVLVPAILLRDWVCGQLQFPKLSEVILMNKQRRLLVQLPS